MSVATDLWSRLRSLVWRRREDRELDEEMRFHVERDAAERMRTGASAEDAWRAARLAFGNATEQREAARDARGVRSLVDFAADVRYAARALRRNPGFTAAAAIVLALGLGAAATVVTVVRTVLLSDLPYPEPDRIVRIYLTSSPENLFGLSVVDAEAIREQQRSFAAFGVLRIGSAALVTAAGPERVVTGQVTVGFFAALGTRVQQGRLIEPTDEQQSAPPVAVVSHRLAERSLGGAAHAVGRSVMLDGVSHTVIGVLPAGMIDLTGWPADVWPVLRFAAPERRGPFGIRAFARLASGTALDEAARDLAGISERIFPLWASSFQDREARYVPIALRDTIVARSQRQLWLFAGSVLLLLLIAVANVATLMLVRIAAREPELALRTALGAGRFRLARLVTAESLLLTALAGALALGVTTLGLELTPAVAPDLPRLDEVTLDGWTIGFVLLGAAFAGLLVALPALARAVTGRTTSSLRASLDRARRIGARDVLVVAELALALPLVTSAGLLINSFVRLTRVDPGFDPTGLVAVHIGLPDSPYRDAGAALRFWREAERRVSSTPGIVAAGIATDLPPDNQGNSNNFDLVARPVPAGTAQPTAPWSLVSPGYFQALGLRLLEGRSFGPGDTAGVPEVVVVSRSWAARYFPGTSAVGQQLVSGGCVECPRTTVIGVVSDVHYGGLAGSGDAVYASIEQSGVSSGYLVARGRGTAPEIHAALRAEIAALDPSLPLVETALAQRLVDDLAGSRRIASVLTAFAAAALLLAALGVFGLMSFIVRQQRREMGIRMALGAAPAEVARMIVARGMRYVLMGCAIGSGIVIATAKLLGALLYGVEPGDPATLAGAVLVIMLAAAFACWLPGRRAARIRPLEAISVE